MAAITVSISAAQDTSSNALAPQSISAVMLYSAASLQASLYLASSATTTNRGQHFCACCMSNSSWPLPVMAKVRYFSGWRLITSRVLQPIEPVAPKTVTVCITPSMLHNRTQRLEMQRLSYLFCLKPRRVQARFFHYL